MNGVGLENELKVYEKIKHKLLKEYVNKVVVIKDDKVIGVYDNEVEAFEDFVKKYGPKPVFIKRVTPEEQIEQMPSYTYGLLSVVT